MEKIIDITELRTVEKTLIQIPDGLEEGENECAIQLNVNDCGSWIIKFRKSGTIVNHIDTVFSDIVTTSATITFKSSSCFWKIIKKTIDWNEGISKGQITTAGSERAMLLFQRKIDINSKPKPASNNNINNNNANNISNSSSSSSGSLSSTSLNKPTSSSQYLKAGWLLKKRDFIYGWHSRYFVVYVGRVEYFVDQHDPHPRCVVPLYGAEVSVARKATINGTPDHWMLTVEPHHRYKEKAFKLASELTGEDGMMEAYTWVQVFQLASHHSEHMPLSPLGIKKASSSDLQEKNDAPTEDERRKARGSFNIISNAAEGAMKTIKKFSQKGIKDDENKTNDNDVDNNAIKYQMIYFISGIMLIAIILSWWLNGAHPLV